MPTYGARAEAKAAAYLTSLRHQIIAQNFQFYGKGRGRRGEIDIISFKDSRIHFVEVKARQNTRFGHPLASITPQKIRTLRQTAEYFLVCRPKYRVFNVQFDVITLLRSRLDYYPRAF